MKEKTYYYTIAYMHGMIISNSDIELSKPIDYTNVKSMIEELQTDRKIKDNIVILNIIDLTPKHD